ncbi:hypothetical protein APA_2533 [Pseudanabaena sp. lw0831]|nr:hypothetical protein APA_2533 [Pseudanabaena sp. lw0831]
MLLCNTFKKISVKPQKEMRREAPYLLLGFDLAIPYNQKVIIHGLDLGGT